ncbi:MFS transporter [Exiguobacterium sp. NG55]|uniref:MFS transporter n=1 Tax=Exiguobacterium sp. NG55 TaxID=375477 RepID=UPI0004DF7B84|nr:MFS transporter [Exiguobacterium sp. NG55]
MIAENALEKQLPTDPHKKRNIYLLFVAQGVNVIGDNFFNLAVMWIVYSQSQSALLTAVIGAVWHLTDIFIGPVAGVIADKYDKVKVLVLSNLTSGIATLLVSIYLFFQTSFPFWVALISVILLNTFSSFAAPARAALIPTLVQKEELNSLNAKFSSIIQIGSLIGAGAGGILLSLLGVPWVILFNAISFFVGSICFVFFKTTSTQDTNQSVSNSTKKPNIFSGLFSGWSYIRENQKLKNILVFLLLLNVISFLGPLYPALVFERLSQSASMYGIIQAMAVVGGILGSLSLSRKKVSFSRPEYASVISLLIVAICLFGLSLSTNIIISTAIMVIQFFALSVNSVILNTLIMNYTEPEYMGRVLGVSRSIAVLLIPIATITAGSLAVALGVEVMFAIASVIMLITSLYGLIIFKAT